MASSFIGYDPGRLLTTLGVTSGWNGHNERMPGPCSGSSDRLPLAGRLDRLAVLGHRLTLSWSNLSGVQVWEVLTDNHD
jgi:hypothetical protein